MMHAFDKLITLALEEDIGPGDITTDNLIDDHQTGIGRIVAKASFVVSGMQVAACVFFRLDSAIEVNAFFTDGDYVEKGAVLFELKGSLSALLKGERTALNFLQRLSGIATHTRQFVNEIEGYDVRLVDTRKTTPGWRKLEKMAVKAGGAFNHRFALYDGVLIKDNHIAVAGGIQNAVETIRKSVSHLVKIEVEVSDQKELHEALAAGADIIMLDNMSIEDIEKSVQVVGGKALLEVSGSVGKNDLKKLAQTGIDIISSGALTHQATSVDISMTINL